MVQDQPMVYDQNDVVDALVMRLSLMQKTSIPLNNNKIVGSKIEIGELVSITMWYNLKARYSKMGRTTCLNNYRNLDRDCV